MDAAMTVRQTGSPRSGSAELRLYFEVTTFEIESRCRVRKLPFSRVHDHRR